MSQFNSHWNSLEWDFLKLNPGGVMWIKGQESVHSQIGETVGPSGYYTLFIGLTDLLLWISTGQTNI